MKYADISHIPNNVLCINTTLLYKIVWIRNWILNKSKRSEVIMAIKKIAVQAGEPAAKAAVKKVPAAKKAPVEKKSTAPKAAAKKASGTKKVAKASGVELVSSLGEAAFKQIEKEAYFIAEKDGFCQDPLVYWCEAEMKLGMRKA